MNKVILLGRLTRDPETTNTATKFSIAVDRKFKKEGQPDADFINIVAFGKTGEFAQNYFEKGKRIALVGRLQVDSWEDKDKNKRTSVSVIAEELHFADSKSEGSHKTEYKKVEHKDDDSGDELPF